MTYQTGGLGRCNLIIVNMYLLTSWSGMTEIQLRKLLWRKW
uniref:Uncharacterized protein n=1 Tax=Anguilla anguilla TaxID=7936 RepID=A0A0E9UKW8_ANGAN